MTLSFSSLQRILLGGSALLIALIVYALAAPVAIDTSESIRLAPHKTFTAPPPFVMPSAERFAVLDDRPLFLASRKPPSAGEDAAKAQSQTASPPPLPQVTLIGVILDGDTKLALVKTAGAAFAQSMVVGSALGGWSVTEIDADKIVLRTPGFPDQTLSLNTNPQSANPQPQHQGLSHP